MADASLPAGWVSRESSSHPGKMYFFNTATGETTWEHPQPAQEGASRTKTTVRASHILVKHTGSRRPASWRADPVVLTKEEAIAKLMGIRQSIVDKKVAFEEVASVESDCSSAKRGGDLGEFGRGMMQKPFEEATYALDVGELSGMVDTDSGVHIILRTA